MGKNPKNYSHKSQSRREGHKNNFLTTCQRSLSFRIVTGGAGSVFLSCKLFASGTVTGKPFRLIWLNRRNYSRKFDLWYNSKIDYTQNSSFLSWVTNDLPEECNHNYYWLSSIILDFLIYCHSAGSGQTGQVEAVEWTLGMNGLLCVKDYKFLKCHSCLRSKMILMLRNPSVLTTSCIKKDYTLICRKDADLNNDNRN